MLYPLYLYIPIDRTNSDDTRDDNVMYDEIFRLWDRSLNLLFSLSRLVGEKCF